MPDLSPTVSRTKACKALDDQLSNRFIALDPAGYFLIKLDRETAELVVEHYRNDVDERGLATDPETGEVLSCRGAGPRTAAAVYRAAPPKRWASSSPKGMGPIH